MQLLPFITLALIPLIVVVQGQASVRKTSDDQNASMKFYTMEGCKGEAVVLKCDHSCKQNPLDKKCSEKPTIPQVCQVGAFKSYYLEEWSTGIGKVDSIFVRPNSQECAFTATSRRYGGAYLQKGEDVTPFEPGCYTIGQKTMEKGKTSTDKMYKPAFGGLEPGTMATWACTWPQVKGPDLGIGGR